MPPADRTCPGERPSFQPEKTFSPPGAENVRFWVLTPRGVYSALQMKKGLESKRSPGWPLFYAGHEVMTGLREARERQGLR